jgi:hypothetical protein
MDASSTSSLLKQFNSQIDEKIAKVEKSSGENYKKIISGVINDQQGVYKKFIKLLEENGSEGTSFIMKDGTDLFGIELLMDYLKCGLDIELIKTLKNPILIRLRDSLICNILALTLDPDRKYLYGPTIRTIFRITEFYDILIRSLSNEPPYYHKYRYERYIEYTISRSKYGLILFPTYYSLGVTDLLKLRAFPLFPIGIQIKKLHVDEFQQTPSEFFVHDINHARRMFEENLKYYEDVKSKYTSIIQFFDECDLFSKQITDLIINGTLESKSHKEKTGKIGDIDIINKKLPYYEKGQVTEKSIRCLDIKNGTIIRKGDPIDKGYAHIIKIIVFEITHEDALPIHPSVVCSTILRGSGNSPVFPRLSQKSETGKIEIVYKKDEGGSILGFVKYKLRYGFFDKYPDVFEGYLYTSYRTDRRIAIGTQILLNIMCGTKVEDINKILILITDKTGLNEPVNTDNLVALGDKYKSILADPDYGDLTDEYVDKIRRDAGLSPENKFTGERPAAISEQNTRSIEEQYKEGLDPNKVLTFSKPLNGGYYKNTKRAKNVKVKKTKKAKNVKAKN